MNKNQAKISTKKITTESAKLQISPIINLYEIDLTDIAFESGILLDNYIFRFHNNVKLGRTSIYWQGNEYISIPISVTGIEWSGKGTLPTPTMSIGVGEEYLTIISQFKSAIYELKDIVGAKVTIITTFAKHLDERNFFNSVKPVDYDPDPEAEYPREHYLISHKDLETKYSFEYKLMTYSDARNKKLPGRLVVALRCPFQYRGTGCCYEYAARRNPDLHGTATLPVSAPPVANDKNELITDILEIDSINDRGEYNSAYAIKKGDAFYIERSGRKHYFVANQDNPQAPPPNLKYWIADSCALSSLACDIRYGLNGSAYGNIRKGVLKYGGFISTNQG